MAALFELRGVTVRRAGSVVLRDLDLDLGPDGVTVLTGPSGSGKSTVLRLCNRLLEPDSGTVQLDGIDVRRTDPLRLRRRVGMVFQRPTPFPGTVVDNLRTAADLSRTEAGDLLGSMDLDATLLDRDARDLSGGEQQRVCLARTVATEPDVLLVDEATSALDHASTRLLEQLVRAIADRGTTVVWVTHDLDQAGRLADRQVSMGSGGAVDDGRDRQ